MSQIGQFSPSTPAPSIIETITGNTGGPVGPDIFNNINVIGAGNINVAGNPATFTETITLVGTTNHAVQIGNASGSLTSIAVGTNGQVLLGATGADPAFGTLTSSDGSITFTTGANALGLTVTGGTTVGKTITGNTGGALSPTAGNWNIVTANSTVKFAGAVSTETLDFALTNLGLGSSMSSLAGGVDNVSVGSSALTAVTSGSYNTAVGFQSGKTLTSCDESTLMGYFAGANITTGEANTAIGALALGSATTGAANAGSNVALGASTLGSLTTGIENTSLGTDSLSLLLTGSYNVAIGGVVGIDVTGDQYTTSESSNILILNTGVTGESNKIRIGTSGSGNGQQNATYIAGISGVNVGSTAVVATVAGTGQIGTATITAGTNVTVTTGANTITIAANTGSFTLNYTGVNHAASPYTVLAADDYISADVTAGVISILLPNAPATGRVFTIKDKVGLAGTSNITVTTVGGAVTIDGSTSFVMNTAYQAISVIFNGTSYEIH